MVCRMCKGVHLERFLDLGFSPPADQFLRREQLREPVVYYPLEVMICADCGLVQLSYVVSPETLYRHDYPYESSITETGRKHWSEFAESTVERFQLDSNDLVVDIGSNVGVLLEAFKRHGTKTVGIEPASNIALLAEKRGVETIPDFFGPDSAAHILREKGQATVITATNVFAHIDDVDSFMHAVDLLLSERGVFIIEAPYFVNLVRNLEYDTIYHEHVSYLSVKPLVRFFDRFDMEILDIQQRDIHGGSFRVFVARNGQHTIASVVEELMKMEEEMGLHNASTLVEFAHNIQKNRQDLIWLLRRLKHQGNRIVGVSAPAKGMTLLNYCNIGTETLDFVTEKSSLKIGRYTPGQHIPVVGDDELLRQRPDYALLLAWNFKEEIMRNLKAYRDAGGHFIIPIPTPLIVR